MCLLIGTVTVSQVSDVVYGPLGFFLKNCFAFGSSTHENLNVSKAELSMISRTCFHTNSKDYSVNVCCKEFPEMYIFGLCKCDVTYRLRKLFRVGYSCNCCILCAHFL